MNRRFNALIREYPLSEKNRQLLDPKIPKLSGEKRFKSLLDLATAKYGFTFDYQKKILFNEELFITDFFYVKVLKAIIIEYDEIHHELKRNKERDIEREAKIKAALAMDYYHGVSILRATAKTESDFIDSIKYVDEYLNSTHIGDYESYINM